MQGQDDACRWQWLVDGRVRRAACLLGAVVAITGCAATPGATGDEGTDAAGTDEDTQLSDDIQTDDVAPAADVQTPDVTGNDAVDAADAVTADAGKVDAGGKDAADTQAVDVQAPDGGADAGADVPTVGCLTNEDCPIADVACIQIQCLSGTCQVQPQSDVR